MQGGQFILAQQLLGQVVMGRVWSCVICNPWSWRSGGQGSSYWPVTQKYLLVPCTAINLYGEDVDIREAGRAGLSQHEVAVEKWLVL